MIQPNYKTGTASVTAGSNIVTGTNTAWALALVNGGFFSCQGLSIPIASVQDDTHLTLDYNAPAAMAGNNLPYSIALGRADIADTIIANRKLADLVDILSNQISPFVRTIFDDADASAVLGTLGASNFFKTLFNDADASEFLTSLGVTPFIKTLFNDADASEFLTSLGVTPFIKTLLDDANSATARATLGVADPTMVLLDRKTGAQLANGTVFDYSLPVDYARYQLVIDGLSAAIETTLRIICGVQGAGFDTGSSDYAVNIWGRDNNAGAANNGIVNATGITGEPGLYRLNSNPRMRQIIDMYDGTNGGGFNLICHTVGKNAAGYDFAETRSILCNVVNVKKNVIRLYTDTPVQGLSSTGRISLYGIR